MSQHASYGVVYECALASKKLSEGLLTEKGLHNVGGVCVNISVCITQHVSTCGSGLLSYESIKVKE